jgi:hypothetical protein
LAVYGSNDGAVCAEAPRIAATNPRQTITKEKRRTNTRKPVTLYTKETPWTDG